MRATNPGEHSRADSIGKMIVNAERALDNDTKKVPLFSGGSEEDIAKLRGGFLRRSSLA